MPVSPQILVRLAIAITASKHKPKDQSITSYLLDLQSHFSLSDDSQVTCDEATWRNHALSLERELESLKQKQEEDEAELVRLRQNATKDMSDDSNTAPPKKKTKKPSKSQELQLQDNDWPAKRQEHLNVIGQSSPSLTAAFISLQSVLNSVSSQTGNDPRCNSRLLAAITRTIDTIGKFIGLQKISTSSVPSELNVLRIAMASSLLVYVLRVAFPALFHQGISSSSSIAVSRLIDTLYIPMVCSFVLLSQAYVMHHLDINSAKRTSKSRKGNEKVPKTPSQTLIPDVRMDLLTLLDEALNTFDPISPRYSGYTAGIKERIALESIRALELLYSTGSTVTADRTMDTNATPEGASRGPESSQASRPHRRRTVLDRKDRLEALARKDSTWYLCHILNSCGGPNGRLGSMLDSALLDGAARIVKMCISMDCDGVARVGRSFVMDVMCRNMVLAACEKIISTLPQENPGV